MYHKSIQFSKKYYFFFLKESLENSLELFILFKKSFVKRSQIWRKISSNSITLTITRFLAWSEFIHAREFLHSESDFLLFLHTKTRLWITWIELSKSRCSNVSRSINIESTSAIDLLIGSRTRSRNSTLRRVCTNRGYCISSASAFIFFNDFQRELLQRE